MNQAELDVVIEKHEKWLRDGYGERANLSYANLRGANLSGANLSYANLRGANLRVA
ncbi:pentapeptide repeat-containing protein, partial [Listeria monocytogenes]|nr:pentapeptide repeat-containing protein [Listeria monocytogenes]EIO5709358.1 pentapeptide repeat-containing protein [Listeria monocytogenes]